MGGWVAAALMTNHQVAVAMTTLSDAAHRLGALKRFRSAYAGMHTVREGLRVETSKAVGHQKLWTKSIHGIKAVGRFAAESPQKLEPAARGSSRGIPAVGVDGPSLAVLTRTHHLWRVARQARSLHLAPPIDTPAYLGLFASHHQHQHVLSFVP
jgi:hypothetical protein